MNLMRSLVAIEKKHTHRVITVADVNLIYQYEDRAGGIITNLNLYALLLYILSGTTPAPTAAVPHN